jgi:IG-like fold at C-terminal of FixG, putative oxidoreductase
VDVELAPAEARWVTVGVQVAPEAAQRAGAGAHPIVFRIDRLATPNDAGDAASIEEKSTFVVPR